MCVVGPDLLNVCRQNGKLDRNRLKKTQVAETQKKKIDERGVA